MRPVNRSEWYPIGSTDPRAAEWHKRNDAKRDENLRKDLAEGRLIRRRDGSLQALRPSRTIGKYVTPKRHGALPRLGLTKSEKTVVGVGVVGALAYGIYLAVKG